MSKKGEHEENMEQWESWIGSCVLMADNGLCAVETIHQCSPKNMTCPFHLTAEQKAESDSKWKERMNALPIEDQQFYAETYYGGAMPWAEKTAAAEETDKTADAETSGE